MDRLIDLCLNTQIFHYVNTHYTRRNQPLRKMGVSEGSFLLTGKPAIKHPLEATVKNKLERALDSDLPDVMLYRGGDNQGILSVFAALALTEGKNVYIREEAYKEGSIETDKILLHEMMHVLQNKNNVKINSIDEREKAEAEAEQAEADVYGDIWAEPVEIIEYKGIEIRITQKQRKEIIDKAVRKILQWVDEQRILLDEEKYLRQLIAIRDFRDSPSLDVPKTPFEALAQEVEEEFKLRLKLYY